MMKLLLSLAVLGAVSAMDNFNSMGEDMGDMGMGGMGGGYKAPKDKTYEEKVKDWKASNKKSDFISKVKKDTKDPKLTGKRGDRLWTHMLDLFDNRGVRFTDEGITYYLPITHHLTFVPDIVCEAIEFVMRFLRFYYYAALHLLHVDAIDKHHAGIEWLNKSGWASLITGGCMVYLGFTAISW